jgi:hypothetical protein
MVDEEPPVSAGDLGLSFATEIAQYVSSCQKNEVLTSLQTRENELHRRLNASSRVQSQLKNIFSGKVHQQEWIEEAVGVLPTADIEALREQEWDWNSGVIPISQLRKVQTDLAANMQFTDWNLKLIRTLRTHLTEII